MDDKYGYVGIRDKSLRFVFFAKYNHISAQMLDWPLSISLCESAYVICASFILFFYFFRLFAGSLSSPVNFLCVTFDIM